jgi:hypothetical protein
MSDWKRVKELAQDWLAAPGPAFDKWPTGDAQIKALTRLFADAPEKHIAVCLGGDRLIGLLALNRLENNRVDLGHVILSDWQDGNIDREAIQAIVEWLFTSTEIDGIETHNANDPPQLQPLKSLGFEMIDVAEPGDLYLSRDGWARRCKHGTS